MRAVSDNERVGAAFPDTYVGKRVRIWPVDSLGYEIHEGRLLEVVGSHWHLDPEEKGEPDFWVCWGPGLACDLAREQ